MNKLDRDGREPLDLIAELEDLLGIEGYAMNWPIGMGKGTQGPLRSSESANRALSA